MNLEKLRAYLRDYRRQFASISQREIYKWRAVKTFQAEWNEHATNFPQMLEKALSRTDNLMDSGSYFPRGMIVKIAQRSPDGVRRAFSVLFDEEQEVVSRIRRFQAEVKKLNRRLRVGKNDYQDDRAAFVYLCMRYPDSYFLYKFGMLKEACEALEINYKPTRGADQNVVQYHNLCEAIRNEILSDDKLLSLHMGRLTEQEYSDPALTILTQDVVYAVTRYLVPSRVKRAPRPSIAFVSAPSHSRAETPSLRASLLDHEGVSGDIVN